VKPFRALLLGLLTALLNATIVACGAGSNGPVAGTVALPTPFAWQVTTGSSSGQEAVQGLSYYPASLTINAGDTVVWTFPSGEPHTVSLLAAGQSPSTLPPPNSPAAQAPAGGSTYDGSTFTSSGFVLLGKTYALTFTKPGTYKVYCLIHQPEMMQTITVQPGGSAYPQTQTAVTAQAQSAIAADLALGQQSVLLFPYAAGGTHLVAGISPGLAAGAPSSATVLRFLDGNTLSSTTATVPVGTTVVWTNQSNNEPHTVTFAPVGQPFPTLNPFGPASGGSTYDGTALVNSGVLLPGSSFSLTFTKAGTYTYHCIFHDDTENMIGTLVVQ
jgi:plastocyanin